MADVGTTLRIPQFVAARTKDGLVRAMLRNNVKHGIEFRYFDIQKDGRTWVAWYNAEVNMNFELRKAAERNG